MKKLTLTFIYVISCSMFFLWGQYCGKEEVWKMLFEQGYAEYETNSYTGKTVRQLKSPTRILYNWGINK